MANLTGYGAAASFPTSETIGTSITSPALGSRWVDGSGNEYIIVDCQQAFVAGEFVYISHDNLATRLTDTFVSRRVGVMAAAVSSSDKKAYAQIYGLYEGAAGTSGVGTSKLIGVGVGTSDLGAVGGFASSDEDAVIIEGAYAVTATDSATTSPVSSFVSAGSSATPYIGFSVWLNYPYTTGTARLAGTTGDT